MKRSKTATLGVVAATAFASLPLFSSQAGAMKPTAGAQFQCKTFGGEWEDLWYLPGVGHISGECVYNLGNGAYSVDTSVGDSYERCNHMPDGPDVGDEVVVCH